MFHDYIFSIYLASMTKIYYLLRQLSSIFYSFFFKKKNKFVRLLTTRLAMFKIILKCFFSETLEDYNGYFIENSK